MRYALDFAGSRKNLRLTICFMQQEPDNERLEATFREIKSSAGNGFRASLDWIQFSPPSVPGFVRQAQALKTDLIIMGTSGSDDPDGSSNTSETVLSTECPVLVVPEGVDEEFRLKEIALVLGPNEIDDHKDLETLLNISRTFNSRVHVLTVQSEPGAFGYSEEEEKNEELLEYYLEGFYAEHVYIRSEDVVQGIFDYVGQKEIDMIAIMPRKHVRKGTPSEGRLTRILTLQSRTPLLAIENC